jgi:hypothetical protein
MPALGAGIYVFTTVPLAKAWMAGTSPRPSGTIHASCRLLDKSGHDDVDQPQHLFSDES